MSRALREREDQQIAYLSKAREALQQAQHVGAVKKIADAAHAAEIFAKRQQMSEETIGLAHALKIDALAKLGVLLREMPKAEGGRPPLKTSSAAEPVLVSEVQTLAELGIDKKTSMVAQQLASLDPAVRRAIADREQSVSQAMRTYRRQNMTPAVPLPDGIFRVFYADPPWQYGNSGVITDGDAYGRAERHYPALSIADLCALPVRERVAKDAVLFLWVTSPLLAECWPVITAWGFTYKASIVWDKDAHNFGSYVSVRHEFLLICTRGSCLPDHPTPMPDSVMTIRKSPQHSEKPAEFRALIERLYDGDEDSRLELFARAPVPGWSTYGNELSAASAAV